MKLLITLLHFLSSLIPIQSLYIKKHSLGTLDVKICDYQTLMNGDFEVLSFWIRQGYSSSALTNIRFKYLIPPSTDEVPDFPSEHLSLFNSSLPTDYQAPQDGTFMWFCFVYQFDLAKNACVIRDSYHIKNKYVELGPSSPFYKSSFKILGAAFNEYLPELLLGPSIGFNPKTFVVYGEQIYSHFVLGGPFSKMDYHSPIFLNMMMRGRSNKIIDRINFVAFDFYASMPLVSNVRVNRITLLKDLISTPARLGYVLLPSDDLKSGVKYFSNTGRMVTLHIYDVAGLFASPASSLQVIFINMYQASDQVTSYTGIKTEVLLSSTSTGYLSVMVANFEYRGYWDPLTGKPIETTTFMLADFTDLKPLVLTIAASVNIDYETETTGLAREYQIRCSSLVRIVNRVDILPLQTEGPYAKAFNTVSQHKRFEPFPTFHYYDISRIYTIMTFANSTILATEIRIYRLNSFYGLVDYGYFQNPALALDALLSPSDYRDTCYFPVPSIALMPGELNNNCMDFRPTQFYISPGTVPSCQQSPAGNYKLDRRRCEFCEAGYLADVLDYRSNKANYSCHTSLNCTDDYTLVTTSAIETALAGSDPLAKTIAQTKKTCVSCPPVCSKCKFNDTTFKIDCADCNQYEVPVTGLLDKCKCKVTNCSICDKSSCDLCDLNSTLHVMFNTVPADRSCYYGLNCIEGYGKVTVDYMNANFTARDYSEFENICFYCEQPFCKACHGNVSHCSACNLTSPPRAVAILYNAIETSIGTTVECRPTSEQLFGLTLNLINSASFISCATNCRICNYSNNRCLQCTVITTPVIYVVDQASGICIPQDTCLVGNGQYLYDETMYAPTVPAPGAKTCRACLPYCKVCTSASVCTTCYDKYFLMFDGTCQGCPDISNCKTCTNATKCDECVNPLHKFNTQTGYCQICDPTTNSFWDATTGECNNCLLGCTDCSSTTICTTCISSYLMSYDKTMCLKSCLPGFGPVASKNCVPCQENCIVCDPTKGVGGCQVCNPGYNLNSENICINCDREGFYLDSKGFCLRCPTANCAHCDSTTKACVQCIYPFYSRSDFSCGTCDAPRVPELNRTCSECQAANCIQCETATKCLTCAPKFKLSLDKECVPIVFEATSGSFNQKMSTIAVGFSAASVQVFDGSLVKVTGLDTSSDRGNFSIAVLNVSADTTNKSVMLLRVSIESSFQKANIQVQFLDPFSIVTAYNDSSKNGRLSENGTIVLIQATPMNWPPEKSAVVQGGTTAAAALTMISAVISFNNAVVLIKIYQMMDFMLLYNVDSPPNFVSFITIFSQMNPTALLPNFLVDFYDSSCQPLGEKFQQQDMGCQFLENCNTSVTIILGYFFLYLLFAVSNSTFRKSRLPRLNKILDYLEYGPLGPAGFFGLVSMFDIDLLISAATNTKYYAGDSVRSFQNIGNNLIAATVMFGFPILVGFYAHRTRELVLLARNELDYDLSEKHVKKWSFLVKGRPLESRYQQYFDMISLMRNYSISMCVVGLYDLPYLQLLSCLALLLASFVANLRLKPMESLLENTANWVSCLFYVACSALFLTSKMIGNKMSLGAYQKYLGWPMVGSFCLLVASNMLPPLIGMVIQLVTAVNNCRKAKSNLESSKDIKKDDTNHDQKDNEESVRVKDLSLRMISATMVKNDQLKISTPNTKTDRKSLVAATAGKSIFDENLISAESGQRQVLRPKAAERSDLQFSGPEKGTPSIFLRCASVNAPNDAFLMSSERSAMQEPSKSTGGEVLTRNSSQLSRLKLKLRDVTG